MAGQRVVVVGGSGRTGALIVEALLEAGHAVVATIRDPKHMAALVSRGVEVAMVDLDISPLADIERAFSGAGAVIFAAGSAEADPSSALDRKGVKRTLLAATKTGVSRYIAISGLGATTKIPASYDWPGMKAYFKAKSAANALVRASGLDWTILEPGTLTDGKATGKITRSEGVDIEDGKIARADVAAVAVSCLGDPSTIGHTFQLVGGERRGCGRPHKSRACQSSTPPSSSPRRDVPGMEGQAQPQIRDEARVAGLIDLSGTDDAFF
jgi:uncharacterized protein YbjT (DUF2867 family)